MIPSRWKQRVVGPPVEPVAETSAPTRTAPVPPVPLSCPGLDAAQLTEVALALHERWHGEYHKPVNNSDVECARLSGAFDDAAAIGSLIAGHITRTHDAGRYALLRAAADCDRGARIAGTPSRDLSPADLTWWEADRQSTLRRLAYARINVRDVGDWLRLLAGGVTP